MELFAEPRPGIASLSGEVHGFLTVDAGGGTLNVALYSARAECIRGRPRKSYSSLVDDRNAAMTSDVVDQNNAIVDDDLFEGLRLWTFLTQSISPTGYLLQVRLGGVIAWPL